MDQHDAAPDAVERRGMFNWRLWGRGLLAAAIGGAATGAIDALTNGDLEGARKTAAIGALVAALAYLKTHPLAD
jgi:hypothetical protein